MPTPLLTFPPPQPNQYSQAPITIKPRSTFLFICGLLPLIFIGSILLFSFYTFFISLVCSHLLFKQGEWIRSFFYSIFFLWFFLGCSGALIQCVMRGGGGQIVGINEFNSRDEEEQESREEEEEGNALLSNNEHPTSIQIKSNGARRYCKKCRIFKPDRTHHCSSCNKCIKKMDHHCPWLGGGCVSHSNYKFFLLFLWYGGILGMYCGFTTMYELSRFVESGPDNFELAPLIWALLLLLGFIFGISLSFFGLYHFYLACNNRTTIEAMEASPSYAIDPKRPNQNHNNNFKPDHALTRIERRKLAKAASSLHVYDLGIKNNLAQVFGGWENKWIWLLPIGNPPGDGITFPINQENLSKLRRITAQIRSQGDSGSDTESEQDDLDIDVRNFEEQEHR